MQPRYSKEEIEKEIKETFNMVPMEGLDLICKYHVGLCDEKGIPQKMADGKYIRPMICLAMCEALMGDHTRIIPTAASIELIHRTSLVFDDIQDNGEERHQRPAVWKIWGPHQAINAGLGLSCYSRLALYRQWERGLSERTVLGMWLVLERTVLKLCRGQYKDIDLANHGGETNLNTYMDMIEGKTAALFQAACEVGAIGAGEFAQDYMESARDFGLYLGVLFQMHDDYLGVWGGDAVGKTANDLAEKKQSLPVVLALAKDPAVVKDLLNRQRPDDLRQFMEDHDISQGVKVLENLYRSKVEELLTVFPKNGASAYLREMIAFFMERET